MACRGEAEGDRCPGRQNQSGLVLGCVTDRPRFNLGFATYWLHVPGTGLNLSEPQFLHPKSGSGTPGLSAVLHEAALRVGTMPHKCRLHVLSAYELGPPGSRCHHVEQGEQRVLPETGPRLLLASPSPGSFFPQGPGPGKSRCCPDPALCLHKDLTHGHAVFWLLSARKQGHGWGSLALLRCECWKHPSGTRAAGLAGPCPPRAARLHRVSGAHSPTTELLRRHPPPKGVHKLLSLSPNSLDWFSYEDKHNERSTEKVRCGSLPAFGLGPGVLGSFCTLPISVGAGKRCPGFTPGPRPTENL